MVAPRRGICKGSVVTYRLRKFPGVGKSYLSFAHPTALAHTGRQIGKYMSTHGSDSGNPPERAKRLVLRKIGGTGAPPSPATPSPLPSNSPQSIAARPEPTRARSTMPPARLPPAATRRVLDGGPSIPPIPRSPSSAFLPPPPPTGGSVSAPAPGSSLSSLDSTASGTAPPNRTRPSLPPVVASLAAEHPEIPSPDVPRARSARKAGLLGAVAGLVLVAMFVIGARIAYRLTPTPTTEAAASTPPPESSTARPAIPSASAPPLAPPITVASTVVVAAPTDSVVREQPRRRLPSPPRPVSPPKVAPPPVASQPAEAPAEGTAAPATASTTGAAPSSSAPADSANSLVPVIPPSPPPEVDPLVKAVLEDNK